MSKINKNKLLICSDFFSLQGEGKTTGIPSYFVRLGICNLHCGMSIKFFNDLVKINKDLPKEQKIPNGHIFEGDLHEEGKATWTCDSTTQWALRGEEKEFQYLIDRWKEQGIYEDIKNGLIHIIWTGGEPTIPQHQSSISNFMNYWINSDIKENDFRININPFTEVETNGTFYIENTLFQYMCQINCSPKLSNSGMSEKQRIIPKAINRIKEHPNYQFKFVISNEDDVKEMFETYVKPFNIDLKKVCCMPGMDDQKDFHERSNFIFEMAKKYKFIGNQRMHISAYNKVVDV